MFRIAVVAGIVLGLVVIMLSAGSADACTYTTSGWRC
jgi:hypothetical protein